MVFVLFYLSDLSSAICQLLLLKHLFPELILVNIFPSSFIDSTHNQDLIILSHQSVCLIVHFLGNLLVNFFSKRFNRCNIELGCFVI